MNYELRKSVPLPNAILRHDSDSEKAPLPNRSGLSASPGGPPPAQLRNQPPRDIYERTFEFALRIVKLCQLLDKQPGVSRTIGRQLLRSGTSVGANIQEGKSGQSRKDFLMKFHIARKEARETLYWLRLLAVADIINHSRLTPLTGECNELVAILTTIIKRTQEGSEKTRVS